MNKDSEESENTISSTSNQKEEEGQERRAAEIWQSMATTIRGSEAQERSGLPQISPTFDKSAGVFLGSKFAEEFSSTKVKEPTSHGKSDKNSLELELENRTPPDSIIGENEKQDLQKRIDRISRDFLQTRLDALADGARFGTRDDSAFRGFTRDLQRALLSGNIEDLSKVMKDMGQFSGWYPGMGPDTILNQVKNNLELAFPSSGIKLDMLQKPVATVTGFDESGNPIWQNTEQAPVLRIQTNFATGEGSSNWSEPGAIQTILVHLSGESEGFHRQNGRMQTVSSSLLSEISQALLRRFSSRLHSDTRNKK